MKIAITIVAAACILAAAGCSDNTVPGAKVKPTGTMAPPAILDDGGPAKGRPRPHSDAGYATGAHKLGNLSAIRPD